MAVDPDGAPTLRSEDIEEQTRMERRALMASYYLLVLKDKVPETLAYELVRDWHAAELGYDPTSD